MKKLILLLLIALMIGSITQAQIKYATYWVAPSMAPNTAEKLCFDSLLIIDYENLINNRGELAEIKQLNPSTKILLYFNPIESWEKNVNNRPLANTLRSQIPKPFYLKRSDGKPAVFWKGMNMLNMSDNCPRVNGKNYNEYYAHWLLTGPLSDTLIDGCFADNGTSTIAWVDPLIDSDNNGRADSPAALNASWQKGMTEFFNLIRKAKGKDFIIVTNKGERYFFFVNNGIMVEKFPNDYLGSKRAGGWYQSIENARRAGSYTIFQVDIKNLEFGLASSLLLDNVYICLGQNMQIPLKLRIPTGKPLGKMYKKGNLYCRNYELVTIEVNPEKGTGQIKPKDTTNIVAR